MQQIRKLSDSVRLTRAQKRKQEQSDSNQNRKKIHKENIEIQVIKKKQKKPKEPKIDIQRINKSKEQKIYLLKVDKLTQDSWSFQVMGSTGNSYNLTIENNFIKCSCMDFRKRQKKCKHIYFIVSRVAQNDELLNKLSQKPTLTKKQYDELDSNLLAKLNQRLTIQTNVNLIQFNQKDEKICQICYDDITSVDIIQCPSRCKNFLHQSCIIIWTNKNNTCPLCRGDWVEDFEEEGAFKMLLKNNIQINDERMGEDLDEDEIEEEYQ